MKNTFLLFLLILFTLNSCSQQDKVSVLSNKDGMKLIVNGKDFIINGMNWDYFPIGTNYSYSLWQQPDAFIKTALDAEMTALKKLGVNTIRVYTSIQPKWITYIYEKYGIYTMLNHSFGRYGVSVNGNWIPVTDYSNVETQRALIDEVVKMASEFKNTPGLLLFLLGNENNYGLFWAGSETEDFPEGKDAKKKVGEGRGRSMYKLMNDAAIKMKSIDGSHPVAICNGDVLFLDIIAEECKDVDIYGTNMYRGKSFGDAFEKVKATLNMPILFTEFGADSFNAIDYKEDQKMQAFYLVENWKEIYENTAGLGKSNNAIGGFTFQFSDGWWKFGQKINLKKHDKNASWASAAYNLDFKEGSNNMNEEWFGICGKGPTNEKGLYTLQPRAAYYALQQVHQLNPFAKGITTELISKHFSEIKF
ncbi:glycoside hydrolase family 2 TIM barrel-domain containing protein [Polaribacter sp.]|uniref:glycoside hydrolase family 2 TIM barrel-domain containing protein n=1 Tax=Polaribacter sp. TaxID=1920175 RepID=UPI003EF2BA9E